LFFEQNAKWKMDLLKTHQNEKDTFETHPTDLFPHTTKSDSTSTQLKT